MEEQLKDLADLNNMLAVVGLFLQAPSQDPEYAADTLEAFGKAVALVKKMQRELDA